MNINIAKRPLIILAGPTAVGKTSTSVALGKALDGEIVSADSVQVYRGLDIGSARVTKQEMEGVPHHLIDVIDVDIDYDVQAFQQMASEAIDGIYRRGHIPILVGGTGFYIQALLYSIDSRKRMIRSIRKYRPASRRSPTSRAEQSSSTSASVRSTRRRPKRSTPTISAA